MPKKSRRRCSSKFFSFYVRLNFCEQATIGIFASGIRRVDDFGWGGGWSSFG